MPPPLLGTDVAAAARPFSQADLDLGNYERFVDITLTRDHNITTGKIYQARGGRGGVAARRAPLPPFA